MKLHCKNCSLAASLMLGSMAVNSQAFEEVVNVPLPGSSLRIDRSFGRQPLAFEPNVGQTDAEVKFLARGKGYQLFLTETEAVMVLQTPSAVEGAEPLRVRPPCSALTELGSSALEIPPDRPTPEVLRTRLVGANAAPNVRADAELRGRVNYFIGNDPACWRTNVPTFGRVRLAEVYPGIDLVYYGNEGQLEYDFVLAPGANPNQIAMEFEGSDRLELDTQGDLIAWVNGRAVRCRKPVVYQESAGRRVEIAGAYRLKDASLTYQAEAPRRIGFELAAYDHSKPLVIDPVLVYSTYLGGGSSDRTYGSYGRRVAADAQGNACVLGYTESLNFPVKNALQSQPAGGGDVFITKFSSNGQLLFSTYLGGKQGDGGAAIAVDGQGKIYAAGWTASTNFPLVNPLQSTFAGLYWDAFVAILSPDGAALVFSTYWGGVGDDNFYGLALDPSRNIYLAGWSGDRQGSVINDFPIRNALQAQPAGGEDAVIVKLSPDGTNVLYSTFFGGSEEHSSGRELAYAIAADADGFAYIVGTTTSYDLPVMNAYQPSLTGDISVAGTPYSDLFYARITPDGSGLVYSSYFGSYQTEEYPDLALGSQGELWLGGKAGITSEGLATPGAFQTSMPQYSHAGFLARFNATNGMLEAATYLGHGSCSSIAVGAAGDVWVGGGGSPGLALVDPMQTSNGDDDAFVAKLSSDCSRLLFSTYFGGKGRDASNGISFCLDPDGNVLLFGDTESKTGFPLANAYQTNLNGTADAFIAKISFREVLKISRTGQMVNLSWPASATNYFLEAATSLPAISWATVTNTPIVTPTERSVQLPLTGNAHFFRLRKP
jgi:hypothetical protein